MFSLNGTSDPCSAFFLGRGKSVDGRGVGSLGWGRKSEMLRSRSGEGTRGFAMRLAERRQRRDGERREALARNLGETT